MGNIFGDTDDITFGGEPTPSRFPRADSTKSPSSVRPQSIPTDRRDKLPSRPHPVRTQSSRPTERSSSAFALPTPPTLAMSLTTLIGSMKETYLPGSSPDMLRAVFLSPTTTRDPLLLLRAGDMTLILGTGFATIENAGKTYPTFPDMRLLQSEKEHIAGWVLLETGFDITLFQMMLEMLDFPFVYGTREVITYIRDTLKDLVILEKCRFFELFSPGVEERKIADFSLRSSTQGLAIAVNGKGVVDAVHRSNLQSSLTVSYPVIEIGQHGHYTIHPSLPSFTDGEIIDIQGSKVQKNTLKFTLDTFYRDAQSIGIVAGYALKDREELASNGVLTFVIEEDIRARAIIGHIFIDSRGFVHAYEMMSVHKQVLKGIRHIYEESIISNPRIERGELVQTLRRELTKYCYLITGRTPVVMPIIIER